MTDPLADDFPPMPDAIGPLPDDFGPLPDTAPGGPDGATDPTSAPVPGLPADPPLVADEGDASLLALVDRLAVLLHRSDLTEIEVEAGGTALVLRKPVTVAAAVGSAAGSLAAAQPAAGDAAAPTAEPAASPAVRAPLTGIFYASPAPGSAPYVQVGGEVAVGQVIGLIEAMKLFNEIKSDMAGRVVRIVAESGQLVKAKQPLIEVEPL